MVIQMDYIRHAGIINWNESRAHVDVAKDKLKSSTGR